MSNHMILWHPDDGENSLPVGSTVPISFAVPHQDRFEERLVRVVREATYQEYLADPQRSDLMRCPPEQAASCRFWLVSLVD